MAEVLAICKVLPTVAWLWKNQRQSPEVSMRHSHNAQFARGLAVSVLSLYVSICFNNRVSALYFCWWAALKKFTSPSWDWMVHCVVHNPHIEGTLAAGRQRHWKCSAPSNSRGCLLDRIDIWNHLKFIDIHKISQAFNDIQCLHSGLYLTVMYHPGPVVKSQESRVRTALQYIEMLMKHDVMKSWNHMNAELYQVMSIYNSWMLKFCCWMMRSLRPWGVAVICGWQR